MPKSRGTGNIGYIGTNSSDLKTDSSSGDRELPQRIENRLLDFSTSDSQVNAENDIINNGNKEVEIEDLLKDADLKDRKLLAEYLMTKAGLEHIPVHVERCTPRGYCGFASIDPDQPLKINKYCLQSQDPRSDEYKTKTVFHEFYHANADGLMHDMDKIGGLDNWAFIDDTFAECSAHYLCQKAGINHEIMPAYGSCFTQAQAPG